MALISNSRLLAAALFTIALLLTASAAYAEYPDINNTPKLAKSGGKDVAVIVAVEDYAFLPDVDGAVDNANAWETFFRRGLGVKQVHMLANTRAAREDMLKFAKRAADDVGKDGTLWFVFVGHGAPTKDGEDGVLVGMDARATVGSLEARGLRQKELLAALEAGGQSQTVVVIDACFSGKTGGDKALAKGMQPVIPTGFSEPKATTLVLSAARSDQFAGPLPGASRPAFSYLLLGALRGWADDGDKSVTAEEAHFWVRQRLRGLDHDQTPELRGKGEVVLTRGVRERDPGVDAQISRMVGSAVTTPSRSEFDVGEIDAQVLAVDSSPANLPVYIDGTRVGQTPLSTEVRSGSHTIEVRGSCHLPEQKRVDVEKGEDLRVKFEPEARPSGLEVRAVDRNGSAVVADVYVDGSKVGKTPGRFKVGVCAKHLEVRADGRGAYETTLSLQERQVEAIKAQLVDADWYFEEGVKFFGKSEFAKAALVFEKACEAGSAGGCHYLGYQYHYAKGVKQDYDRARGLYEKASQGGYATAFNNLAYMYQHAKGVAKDSARASRLYEKGCNAGYVAACYTLGDMYHFARGIPEDFDRARFFYEKASQEGYANAFNNLGYMYRFAQGVPEDLARARELYTTACDKGSTAGCFNVGDLYHFGRGVSTDYTRARLLYEKSCEGDYNKGCHNLAYLYEHGQGVSKDPSKARRLYQKSCDLGYEGSCDNARALESQ